MSVVEDILEGAARYVEQGWTTGANARDENGKSIGVRNPRAVCWCAWGAIVRAAYDDEGPGLKLHSATTRVRNHLEEHFDSRSISIFNDCVAKSADEVAAMLRASKTSAM